MNRRAFFGGGWRMAAVAAFPAQAPPPRALHGAAPICPACGSAAMVLRSDAGPLDPKPCMCYCGWRGEHVLVRG